jgi:hypothetical protein
VIDLVDFSSISFDSGVNIKRLCKYLDQLVGVDIRYDTFTIRNTRWLWLVTDNMLAMNSDRVLTGVVRIYAGFVSGFLSQVEEINFYVLSNEQLK